MWAVAWKNNRFGGGGGGGGEQDPGNTVLRYLFLIKEHALFWELTAALAGTAFTWQVTKICVKGHSCHG